MSRSLSMTLILILMTFFSATGWSKNTSDNPALRRFTERILTIAREAQSSQTPPRKIIEKINQEADKISKDWDQLLRSGQAQEKDLSNPQSSYSEAFRVYTHFIMMTQLEAEKDHPPSPEDCRSKKLQMQFDYPNEDSSPVQLSPGDQVIEALRRSICREN